MDSYDAFRDYEHRVGRWWMLTGFALLLAVPTAICIRYDAWPPLTWVLKGLLGVAPIYWTVGTIEVLTYVPMLGTGGSYLGFFTGNLTSLKVPCALNAMEAADVEPGTEAGEVISTIAIAVSALVTTAVIAIGVLLLSRGVPISGSDRLRTDVTARLEALGAKITYEHKPENVEGASLIVRTAAVHDDNPEIVRAHELGIPVMERAEAWGHLMRDYDNVVCLAGTHGKTTSTSMMTLMTMEAQMDPTVMVGSNLPAIGGTLRIGGKGCFVAESSEYCNSFLRYAPTVAVILNVEEDHLDFFKDINDIIHSFHEIAELTPMNGLVVVNGDDPHAMRSVAGINRKVRTFGTSATSDVYPTDVRDENGYYRFTVMVEGMKYAKVALSVPGRHNMLNALACCAAAEFLGVPGDAAERGLIKFTGSSRR